MSSREAAKGKILFLISTLHGGGAERVATTLLDGLSERGWDLTVVTSNLTEEQADYDLHPRVRKIRIAQLRAIPMASRLMSTIGKLLAIRQLIEQERPNAIVSFLTNSNCLALLSTVSMNVPVVVCERVDPAGSVELPLGLRVLRRLLYPRAARLIVQTTATRDRVGRWMMGRGERVAVIGNPLPKDIDALSAATEPVARGPRVIMMGRLVPQKRFDLGIRAFESGLKDLPDWSLHIWGEGPLHESLLAEARATGLGERVRLHGRTSRPFAEIAASEILLLTSAYEGFPNVMLEAMALGIPCVSVDCPAGPRELSKGGQFAELVPQAAAAALGAALRGLALDPERRSRLGSAGRTYVRQTFSSLVILDQWEQLLRGIRLEANPHVSQ
ncbi:MAG: glycosyltransferase [Proteobacteria bacterium]|nr:glycosyltransferase [Pseudomonadota bacterium]